MRKSINLLLVIALFPVVIHAQLSGFYSVGPGRNFNTLSDAWTAISANGLSGNVTLRVVDGVHVQSTDVNGPFTYVGGPYTVTVRSFSNDPESVILAGSPGNPIFSRFTDVAGVRFENVSFANLNNAVNVFEMNGCTDFSFRNCLFGSSLDGSQFAFFKAINMNGLLVRDCIFDEELAGGGSAHTVFYKGSALNFLDNSLETGTQMVYFEGEGLAVNNNYADGLNQGIEVKDADDIEIRSNVLLDHRFFGVQLTRCSNASIVQNRMLVENGGSSVDSYGIRVDYPEADWMLHRNRIECYGGQRNLGISVFHDVDFNNGDQGAELWITNNLVSVGNGCNSGAVPLNSDFGLYYKNGTGQDHILHNSFNVVAECAGNSIAAFLLLDGRPGFERLIQNNNCSNLNGGLAFYLDNCEGGAFSSIANNFYSTGTEACFTSDPGNCSTGQFFATAADLEQQSPDHSALLSVDPDYLNPAFPLVRNRELVAGVYLPAVPQDFNGVARNNCVPTIGANELGLSSTLGLSVSGSTTVYNGYPDSACTTLQLVASGGSAPYSYQWIGGPSSETYTVCPEVNTTYRGRVTDANGAQQVICVAVNAIDVRCGSNQNRVELCPANGQQTVCVPPQAAAALLNAGGSLGPCPANKVHLPATSLRVYPNPAQNQLQLESSTRQIPVTLFDAQGRQVAYLPGNSSGHFSLDVSELPRGIYVVQHGSQTQRIILH